MGFSLLIMTQDAALDCFFSRCGCAGILRAPQKKPRPVQDEALGRNETAERRKQSSSEGLQSLHAVSSRRS